MENHYLWYKLLIQVHDFADSRFFSELFFLLQHLNQGSVRKAPLTACRLAVKTYPPIRSSCEESFAYTGGFWNPFYPVQSFIVLRVGCDTSLRIGRPDFDFSVKSTIELGWSVLVR